MGLPLDQNGFLNKVRNIDVVLGAQLQIIYRYLLPCTSLAKRTMTAATAGENVIA